MTDHGADDGKPTVGFVGLGNMGAPMAANLANAGFDLVVHDINAEAAKDFVAEHGGRAAEDLGDLGESVDILVTMLPTGRDVRQVLIEEDGGALAESLGQGTIVVDMSSSEPVGTRELGAALKAYGVTLVDAPVSGGVPRAVTGELAIMIGADDEAAVERAMPAFEAMGARHFRTGGLGTGHAMKALNNYAAAAAFAAVSEALLVGRRFGLDPAVMIDIMNASTGRSFNTEGPMKEHVLTRSFATGFQLGLMTKDVKIAGDLAECIGVDAPVSRLVRERWAEANEAVGAREDFTAAIRHWENTTGVGLSDG